MKYVIKMMTGDKLTISQETFNNIAELKTLSASVKINELGGIVNLSSIVTILPKDISDQAELENPKVVERMTLYDGTRAIKKFGVWVDEDNQDVRLDTNFYSELRGKEKRKELGTSSKFSNGIKNLST